MRLLNSWNLWNFSQDHIIRWLGRPKAFYPLFKIESLKSLKDAGVDEVLYKPVNSSDIIEAFVKYLPSGWHIDDAAARDKYADNAIDMFSDKSYILEVVVVELFVT